MWMEKVTKKDGKISYKYHERFLNPKTNKIKKISITYSKRVSNKTAILDLEEKKNTLLNKVEIKKPNLSFYDLIDEWYQIYMQQVKESTYLSTKHILNTIKLKIDKDTIASKITPIDLNNLLEEMIYTDGLSNKYVSIIKSKLNLIFTYAWKKGYIETNPIDTVSITYKREEKTLKIKEKFLEDDEYERLVNYTKQKNIRYALLFQWLYLTGMRAGEALALSDELGKDIILSDEANYAIVEGTMLYRERKVTEMEKSDSTKTEAGMREVDLPQKAIEIFNKCKEINTTNGFLFQTSRGTPIQLTAINTFLRDHKERMKINKPLSSHIFRHTHVSKLAELGTPLHAIQDRVGHENSDITERIYLHVTKGIKAKLRDDIERL